MNKLTVIIPFLNEGIEVENTLNSIRATARNNVDILLINDNSTDDVDYKSVANKYNAKYIKNKERKGVAQSRDIGVAQISTPYFILLDAHMRFYQNDWWDIATKHLEENDRAIYCFKCVSLDKEGKIKLENKVGCGAFINLFGDDYQSVLEPFWIRMPDETEEAVSISCVLGASYCMSKRYWDYLKGLSMLRYYGADEAYISLKVWLEGGHCKLITSVKVGHIFRTDSPFKITNADSIHNKLIIAETILPEEYKQYIHLKLKEISKDDYYFALSLLSKKKTEIERLKNYYQKIFTRDFTHFKKINNQFYQSKSSDHNYIEERDINSSIDKKLKKITDAIINHNTKSEGFMVGALGEVIYLYEYAHHYNDKTVETSAKEKINNICENYNCSKNEMFSGNVGFILGITYLNSSGFSNINILEMLPNIYCQLADFMRSEIERNNYSLMRGAVGVGYLLLPQNDKESAYQLNYLIGKISDYANNIISSKQNIVLNITDGIIGIFLFLVASYKRLDTDKSKIISSLSFFIEYIVSQMQDIKKYGSYFPEIAGKPSKSGLMWKSGDLIIAYSLLKAAQVLNDRDLHNKALHILISTTKRVDPVIESVWDAGLYHGSSGLAYLYNKLYRETKNNSFKEAENYWLKETLYKATGPEETAGYWAYGFTSEEINYSILCGISGIGISLLSLKNNSNIINKILAAD